MFSVFRFKFVVQVTKPARSNKLKEVLEHETPILIHSAQWLVQKDWILANLTRLDRNGTEIGLHVWTRSDGTCDQTTSEGGYRLVWPHYLFIMWTLRPGASNSTRIALTHQCCHIPGFQAVSKEPTFEFLSVTIEHLTAFCIEHFNCVPIKTVTHRVLFSYSCFLHFSAWVAISCWM